MIEASKLHAHDARRNGFDFHPQRWAAGGTNYLVATTDLALPTAQWLRVATNQFDLAGNYAITNTVPVGLPQQFYRVALP